MSLIELAAIALFFFILFNLFRIGFIMLRHEKPSVQLSRFLGRRLLYCAIALLLIIIAVLTGLITLPDAPVLSDIS